MQTTQHFVVSFRSIMKLIVKVLGGLSLSRSADSTDQMIAIGE